MYTTAKAMGIQIVHRTLAQHLHGGLHTFVQFHFTSCFRSIEKTGLVITDPMQHQKGKWKTTRIKEILHRELKFKSGQATAENKKSTLAVKRRIKDPVRQNVGLQSIASGVTLLLGNQYICTHNVSLLEAHDQNHNLN